MKWLGLKNGELLMKAASEKFDLFITADQQLKHQQNLPVYNVNIVILRLPKNDFPNQLLKIPGIILINYRKYLF